jgi:predicted transcriptional regulator of viral defense system
MINKRIKHIKNIFTQLGPIIKREDLVIEGISDRDLQELLEGQLIIRVKPGYYYWNENQNFDDMEIIQSLFPRGVFSIFTAASKYELTTVNPMSLHMTIPSSMKKPVLPEYPPVELYYISEKNLDLGCVEEKMDHGIIRIYDPERTVCDFFKYLDKTGKDVAEEVIKNYLSSRNRRIQKLYEYARKLRVMNHIKAYVEILT